MKFSKLVAFLMAVLLCVGAVAVSFAANSELTEKQSEKLYSIAYKALRGEGYKVNTYEECTAESVNNIRWITFLKGGKMKWRCDVTHKGNVNYLVNYDFYQKETTIKDAKTAKKSEIRKAMNKINSFLKKYNPKLLKRVKKLKLDQVLVRGKYRYLDFWDQQWQGMSFMIRVAPSVRIEVFSAPLN